VRSLPSEEPAVAAGPRRSLPAWAVTEGPFGIRLFDVGIVALVIAVIEINVYNGGGGGAVKLNFMAWLFGALLAVPILFRHRWPFQVLIASAVVMFFYYIFARRNISPAPLFFVPLYDAAVEGYLALAIAIPAVFMVIGLFVVEASTRQGFASLGAEFLSQTAILALAVTLGEVVRSRRALTAETARRLRLADWERAAEAGRVVAEERLRIARELHDTVAHSMATITVQAGSALHLLGSGAGTSQPLIPNDAGLPSPGPPSSGRGADADPLRAALTAIRETSKAALNEMRSVLGQLRRSDGPDGAAGASAGAADAPAAAGKGLSRLDALRDAVTAAGATVTVDVEGDRSPLSAETDHSAYRILQESLTNVLRHAGPGSAAQVCLRYQPGVLIITVTDDGQVLGDGQVSGDGQVLGDGKVLGDGNGASGHGISGMRERAASVGGELTAGPLPGGGFQVMATLPTAARSVGSAGPAGLPAAREEAS
jgi:signal transduction histidine kinase